VFEDFYSTFATVSLTVTGLWMYVASSRFRDWMTHRDHFRRASAISVQLAFPGVMCLFALIDPGSRALWRVSFGVTSVAAIILLVNLMRLSSGAWAVANTIGMWLAVALFACVCIVAVAPGIVDDLGARQSEFFLFIVLLLDGITVGWLMLFDRFPDDTQVAP
jgi:hypothetical protein